MMVDSSGNLYGTMESGGVVQTLHDGGAGTVYELPSGSNSISILANFNSLVGGGPTTLTMDSKGNLFGTTSVGGIFPPPDSSAPPEGSGTVFEIAAGAHAFSTLAEFDGFNGQLANSIYVDAQDDVFGTAALGGQDFGMPGTGGAGTVFEVPAGSGNIVVLHDFTDTRYLGSPLIYPVGLFEDANGDLIGTVQVSDDGVAPPGDSLIYELTPPPADHVVFVQQPSDATAGDPFDSPVTVAVENSLGSIATYDNSDVTLELNGGAGTLSGTMTAAAVNGIATFSAVAPDTAGMDTLTASDGSLASATSISFMVNPGPARGISVGNAPHKRGGRPDFVFAVDRRRGPIRKCRRVRFVECHN